MALYESWKHLVGMGKAEQALYRAGLRLLKQYDHCQIPFTGIHGTHYINWWLDPTISFRVWSKEPSTTFEGELEDR